MKTEVIMKRELFGSEIGQSSKTGFFNATDVSNSGRKWREKNGLSSFNLSQYLKLKSTTEFIEELEKKTNEKALIIKRGRNGGTWVHPLLFIDIALAISPKLKIEVYDWIFDNLIKFRNESGDSYREASAALYGRFGNHREFPEFMKKVAKDIKDKLKVDNWENASEQQLKDRDKIHMAIKLYSNVLTDPSVIVRMAIHEVL